MSGRQYTAVERAEAVALAAAIGPVKAAEQLHIPRRTVSYWLRQPAQSEVIRAAERDVAGMLREAHAEVLVQVKAGLRDPKAKLGDKAQALRVLGEQLALAEGRATSHNLNVNAEALKPTLSNWTDALSEDEIRDLMAWLDRVIDASDVELKTRTARFERGRSTRYVVAW